MIAFAGATIDRADAVRNDPAALTVLARDPAARWLVLDGLDPPLTPEGGLAWQAGPGEVDDTVFLGLAADGPRFAASRGDGGGLEGRRAWAAWSGLGSEELALYGAARAVLSWHARHRFCAKCGAPSVTEKGGWQRTCADPACATQHFPRVDPVTIMLVEHDGRLLLGRQPPWPRGSYSALAGFVEPGESIEEAVAREVFEEAGVRVRAVRYVASQPWPFPSNLMIGCHALAEDERITLDQNELEDARWFSRAEVTAAVAGAADAAFLAPPPQAIARHLLDWWLAQAPALDKAQLGELAEESAG